MVVPLAGLAMLCTGSATFAEAAKPRLQPGVTADGDAVGFRVRSKSLPIAPVSLDVGKFAFTAPGRVASSKIQTAERGFTFTPSRKGKGKAGGVSVAMTARTAAPAPAADTRLATADTGIAPSGYNFDLSVGYKGFNITGGTTHVDGGLGGRSHKGLDVGVGYQANNWHAGILASADRDTVSLLPRVGTPETRYAVEARGGLDLTPKISLGGSLRYRPALQNPSLLDPSKDDRAVLLGGAVSF